MMLNIQMQITGINHMSQYIHIENTLDDISQFVLYFWSNISAALVSRRDQALLLASGVLYVVCPVVSTVSGQDRCHIAGNAIQSLSEVKSGKDAVVWLSIKAVFVLWSLLVFANTFHLWLACHDDHSSALRFQQEESIQEEKSFP